MEERPSVNPLAVALGDTFPFLMNLAGSRFKKFAVMKDIMAEVASDLIERVRREEHDIQHVAGDRSIIGLLSKSPSRLVVLLCRSEVSEMLDIVKSESDDASTKMTHAEVAAQASSLCSLFHSMLTRD
jgi:hypothetical protein